MSRAEWMIVGIFAATVVITMTNWLWEQTRAIKVRWNEHSAGFPLPSKSYDGDAGWDLYCSEDAVVRPGQYKEIPCGFDIELPSGAWALLHSRSSTLRERGLLINSAVFDTGYRGPVFVGVWNLGREPHRVLAGDRLAQLIPIHHTGVSRVKSVKQLSNSERGANGFGSSGT